MTGAPLRAALVDVGGTLWPDHWVLSEEDQQVRIAAVQAVLPQAELTELAAAVAALTARVEEGPGNSNRRRAVELIGGALEAQGWPCDNRTVRAVRRALCLELGPALTPFDGAESLLAGLKAAGMRCVILSNTTFRDAEVYGRDFSALGWDAWLDGCVTSIDAGCAKPDPRIFELALQVAEAAPEDCVMIGNSEDKDIVPARALGLRTVRVAIEQPPSASQADVVVTSLTDALVGVLSWRQSYWRGPMSPSS